MAHMTRLFLLRNKSVGPLGRRTIAKFIFVSAFSTESVRPPVVTEAVSLKRQRHGREVERVGIMKLAEKTRLPLDSLPPFAG